VSISVANAWRRRRLSVGERNWAIVDADGSAFIADATRNATRVAHSAQRSPALRAPRGDIFSTLGRLSAGASRGKRCAILRSCALRNALPRLICADGGGTCGGKVTLCAAAHRGGWRYVLRRVCGTRVIVYLQRHHHIASWTHCLARGGIISVPGRYGDGASRSAVVSVPWRGRMAVSPAYRAKSGQRARLGRM